jgi:hypothetical protein
MPIALIVVVDDTLMGPEYNVDVAVGVLPLVVYLISAPDVVVLKLTDCAEVYVPPAGLNVGVATVVLMVYVALATDELVIPDFIPIALMVRVVGTLIADEYNVDDAVGVLPSVVYLISAPDVVVLKVTDCAAVYVPPAGLNVGVSTT